MKIFPRGGTSLAEAWGQHQALDITWSECKRQGIEGTEGGSMHRAQAEKSLAILRAGVLFWGQWGAVGKY